MSGNVHCIVMLVWSDITTVKKKRNVETIPSLDGCREFSSRTLKIDVNSLLSSSTYEFQGWWYIKWTCDCFQLIIMPLPIYSWYRLMDSEPLMVMNYNWNGVALLYVECNYCYWMKPIHRDF